MSWTEEEKRRHRCCFTGHRPEKLRLSEREVCAALEREIHNAITDGFHVFISGMARGTDIWAAEIVLFLRDHAGLPIRLICASPYEGFETSWKHEWKKRYNKIMKAADLIRFISPGYDKGCFQRRNIWMVNHSARVIAAYNGEPGGTRNTIQYAGKHGIDIRYAVKPELS